MVSVNGMYALCKGKVLCISCIVKAGLGYSYKYKTGVAGYNYEFDPSIQPSR